MEEKKIKVMVEKRGQIYAFDLDEEEEMTQDEIEGYLADMEYRRMKDMELMWDKKKEICKMLDYYKEKIKKAKLNLKLVEIGILREIEGYSKTLEHYGLRNFLEKMAVCYELVGELDSEINHLEEKIKEGGRKNERI